MLVKVSFTDPGVDVSDDTDPKEGLATIEAIYCAHKIMGWSTKGLLAHYRWNARFMQENGFS